MLFKRIIYLRLIFIHLCATKTIYLRCHCKSGILDSIQIFFFIELFACMFFEFQAERELNFLQNRVKMNLIQSTNDSSGSLFLKISYYEVRLRYFQNIGLQKNLFNSENECKKYIKSVAIFKRYVIV